MKGDLFINIRATVLFAWLALCLPARGQQIDYSIPLNESIRNTTFDIIGFCNNDLLIYKHSFSKHQITCYDKQLKVIDQIPLKFLPQEVKQADFVNLKSSLFMVYQYTRKRDIYCQGVMLNETGQPMARPQLIDKIQHPDKVAGDKAYTLLHSDDKSKMMVLAVLRDEDNMLYHIRTFLFDSSMTLLQKGSFRLSYSNEADRLDQFSLSNDGSFYFLLSHKSYAADRFCQSLTLYCKPERQNKTIAYSVPCGGHLPGVSALLKIDEPHGKLWVTALAYDDKSRDIDRLAIHRFSLDSLQPLQSNVVLLTESLKMKMQGKNEGLRQTFNDYRPDKMIIDQQENALLVAEEEYADADNIMHYDNLALFALGADGSLLQLQKIKRYQGYDLPDVFASYLLVNTGHALHFLMNQPHKVFRFLNNYVYLLRDYRYNADGRLQEMPVMRRLDNKERWAPRYGVQVSRNEVIIPCVMGSSLLFGKITWDSQNMEAAKP